MATISRARSTIRKTLFIVVLAPLVMLDGCAHVEPWERGTLARPQMALDPHPLQRALHTHVQESREASSGNGATVGGGCGCY